MSRLKDMYRGVRNHAGKIVAGVVIIGALAGIRSCTKSMGEEVYRGNIGGQEVVYEEGLSRYLHSGNFLKNRMTVKKDNLTYILDDIYGETGIKTPDFANQKLEIISIQTPDTEEVYHSKDNYQEDLNEQHTKAVFDKGNGFYNDLRAKIRAKIESKYKATEEQIPQ